MRSARELAGEGGQPCANQAAADEQATAGPGELIRAVAFTGVTDCPDLESAVAAAYRSAGSGGVVLLSPGAPSFGQFRGYRGYRDRGEAFARAMRAIP